NGEERRFMHKKKESLLGNRGDFASRLGLGGGRARRSVDERHLSEKSPRAKFLNALAVSLDFALSGADDVHFVALVARRADSLARTVGGGRESCIGQKLEIDRSHRHAYPPCPFEGSRDTL